MAWQYDGAGNATYFSDSNSNVNLASQINTFKKMQSSIYNPLNLTNQMGYGSLVPNTYATQQAFSPIFKDADGKIDFVAAQGLNTQQFTIPKNMDYDAYKKPDDSRNIWSYAGQGLGYLLDNADNIAKISNGVLGWMNYAQNKKLIDKNINAIDEQIAASKEYRQQRKDEIDRLNRVRSNTSKAFNTGSVITRSY